MRTNAIKDILKLIFFYVICNESIVLFGGVYVYLV